MRDVFPIFLFLTSVTFVEVLRNVSISNYFKKYKFLSYVIGPPASKPPEVGGLEVWRPEGIPPEVASLILNSCAIVMQYLCYSCAILVLFGAILVQYLCYSCAILILFLCYSCAILMQYLCYSCAILCYSYAIF